jgi:hypothetical protein
MIAKVDGYQVSADALWWPAMNFNQFNWDKPLGMYNLEIPRAAFCERLRSVYEQCAAELKADDVYDPDGVPHLREIGYPLLDVLEPKNS